MLALGRRRLIGEPSPEEPREIHRKAKPRKTASTNICWKMY